MYKSHFEDYILKYNSCTLAIILHFGGISGRNEYKMDSARGRGCKIAGVGGVVRSGQQRYEKLARGAQSKMIRPSKGGGGSGTCATERKI